jgi:hypothetical protein
MNIQSLIDFRAIEPSATYLCWTRMQAESGQKLEQIVARKDRERSAGSGLFFWGVGNPPARFTSGLALSRTPVELIFSVMKGKPKAADERPDAVVAWNAYVDALGHVQQVPPHVLVTSRRDTAKGPKTAHYALICRSHRQLELRRGDPFNHHEYRNAGVTGGPIGASQVTALVRPAGPCSLPATYEANMRARLVDGYWVKLLMPSPIHCNLDELPLASDEAWVEAVGKLRKSGRLRS